MFADWMPQGPWALVLPLVAAALALVARGIVMAGEAAVGTVGPERAQELAAESRRGRIIARLKADPDVSVATGRAAAALALAAATAFALLFADELARRAADTPGRLAIAALAVVGTWLATVAADAVSRSVVAAHTELWALRTAPVLLVTRQVLSPAMRLVGRVTGLALRPFGVRVRFAPLPPPLEEIERLLVHTAQAGAPEPALVRSLFEFGERTVKEIAVPRTNVTAIAYGTAPRDLVRFMVEEGHTRVPVYKGTLDSIVGLIHVKDLLPLLDNPDLIILDDLLRPVSFVPWNRPISKVMRELQRSGQHLAVVVDEYGGMEGIVTLEDIVEQIVGDIRDEFDEEKPRVVQAGDGSALVRADLRIGTFNDTFGVAVPEDAGYETVGGFLSSLAGAIPAEGDRFYYGGLELLVTRRDPRRVLEVKVTRTRPGADVPASANHV